MKPVMQIISVPLNKLDVSTINVRQSGRDQGIAELAALIASQGLLNPLQVTATWKNGKPTGRHGVIAGGRRLAALNLLVSRKELSKVAPIDCCLVDDDRAAEISLAENSGRVAMHPADQFEAFARLHDNGTGLTVDRIALRFGVSDQTVRQRLRLATLSPALLETFRDGRLTLDQVMAYALTDDHEAQERVFAAWPTASTHYIRQQLTQGEVAASDRRARFVGIEAYEAAGGTVRRDLFTEDQGGWMTDPLLLDRLVTERLTGTAEMVRAEGWGWVEVLPQLPVQFWTVRRVLPVRVGLSEADDAALAALRARSKQIEDEGGDEYTEEQDAELNRIEAEAEAIEAKQEAFAPADMARSGAFVTLENHGLRIERGILRPEVANENEADAGQDAEPGSFQPLGERVPKEKGEAGLPAAFAAELAAHRTAGLQAEVAGRPHLALCVLIHSLIEPHNSPCTVRVVEPALEAVCPGINETGARIATDPEAIGHRVPADDALLPWLIEQETDTLLSLLAPLVARGIDAGHQDWTTERGTTSDAAQLARIALLDMRLWWKADAASYFGRVPKSMILDAVRDGAGIAATAEISGLKKAPMADAATRQLDGKEWLPGLLRVPQAEALAEAAE